MDEQTRQAIAVCPPPLRRDLERFLSQRDGCPEEVRLRAGRPVTVCEGGRETTVLSGQRPVIAGEDLLRQTLAAASDYARYAIQDELSQGYCTIPGGHRLGVCGQAVTERGTVRGFKYLTSVNLRIAREHPGCAERLCEAIRSMDGGVLILGPPGRGKTTVLRDAVRLLSDRCGQRVGIVDERGELAACHDGVPGLNVGLHTDVLTGTPKAEGLYLLLRSMSPDWIAVDEITSASDTDALCRASYCGVRLLVTVHAAEQEDLRRRPVYRELLSGQFFRTLAVIQPNRELKLMRM